MTAAAPTPTLARPSYIKDLVLLFSIPLGIAALAAAIVYVPSLSAKPKYSFIYSYCPDYSCYDGYTVDKTGRTIAIEKSGTDDSGIYATAAKLAYYDAATGGSRILDYDEARSYKLINSSKSPDGYALVRNTGSGGFLFWSDYKDSWQLQNGLKKKEVRLNGQQPDYANNITFIGWVQQ